MIFFLEITFYDKNKPVPTTVTKHSYFPFFDSTFTQ